MNAQELINSLDNYSEETRNFILALNNNPDVTIKKCTINNNGLARITCVIHGAGATIKLNVNATGPMNIMSYYQGNTSFGYLSSDERNSYANVMCSNGENNIGIVFSSHKNNGASEALIDVINSSNIETATRIISGFSDGGTGAIVEAIRSPGTDILALIDCYNYVDYLKKNNRILKIAANVSNVVLFSSQSYNNKKFKERYKPFVDNGIPFYYIQSSYDHVGQNKHFFSSDFYSLMLSELNSLNKKYKIYRYNVKTKEFQKISATTFQSELILKSDNQVLTISLAKIDVALKTLLNKSDPDLSFESTTAIPNNEIGILSTANKIVSTSCEKLRSELKAIAKVGDKVNELDSYLSSETENLIASLRHELSSKEKMYSSVEYRQRLGDYIIMDEEVTRSKS